jgi:copper chaperone CopZ
MKRLRYFSVDNMKSEEDAEKVRKVLEEMDGVERVEVDLDANALEVEYEDTKITKEMMAKLLQSHGFFMRI